MRLSKDLRRLIGVLYDWLNNKSLVSRLLGVDRGSVIRWSKRRGNLKDKPRKPKNRSTDGSKKKSNVKITKEVGASIVDLRLIFKWGCARIKQHLWNAPSHVRKEVPGLVQGVWLSRQSINDFLTKRKLNGYAKKKEGWKFFRAENPNKLWQLDPKGPVTIQGKRTWFVVCIDDYSRYMLMAEQYDHAPSCKDIQKDLLPLIKKHRPENILTDNNPFKKDWDKWLKEHNVKSQHAHPYYPQDKGKVERAIRNLTEEFINPIKKFPHWLKENLEKYKDWYNNERIHLGIQTTPHKLYTTKPPD